MLGSAPLRLDAIRAVAAFDNERLGRLLIERYPGFSAARTRGSAADDGVASTLRPNAH